MSDSLPADPAEALLKVQRLVAPLAPRAKCELWDYDHRIRCGDVTAAGQKIEFDVVWRGLTSGDIIYLGEQLAEAFTKARERP